MAANLLHSLTDENPDLQKQIGCMTGIFQMFNHHHILTGHHIPKRLPQGNSQFNNGNLERETNNVHQRSVMENSSSQNFRERQRVSTESSRASFSSSSRSSSFSSLDCNRTTQLEPPSYDQILFPEAPSRNPSMIPQTSFSQFGRHTLDLCDVVKDSMYREVQGLSFNAKSMQEAADPVLKYRDTPKPLPKICDDTHGSGLDTKKKLPADLKESLRVLSKLREASCNHNEPRELLRVSSYNAKDGSLFSISKDAPRFSYDGREINCVPFESRDISKSTIKFKDLPRLSLDSREGSMQNLNSDSKSKFSAKSWQKDGGDFDDRVQNSQQTSRNQARPPSVVAKLMGLEMLPDAGSARNSNTGSSRIYQDEDFVYSSRSSEKLDLYKSIQLSLMTLRKEPTSPRWRNPDTVMKPISRSPIEPAPWKRIDGKKGSKKPASTSTRGPGKVPNTFPSVFSEVEERLKDLEFTESGKDLRALKQILEAMQAKGLLETQDIGQDSSLTSDREQKYKSSMYDAISASSQKLQSDKFLVPTMNRKSLKSFESPIVIMKPAKLVKKSDIPSPSVISLDSLSGLPNYRDGEFEDDRKGLTRGRIAKDQISRTSPQDNALNSVKMKTDSRTQRTTQTSKRSHHLSKDSIVGPGKSSGFCSPRIQQKKLDQEKSARPPTPTNLSKSTKQSNKQPGESNSPCERRRPKHPSLQQRDDQLSEVSSESRNLCYPENEISVHSNEIIVLHTKNVKVISSERSLSNVEKKSPLTVSEEESAEFAHVSPEYPSPVSVLDNAVYTDGSTSPVKLVGETLKGDESIDSVRNLNKVQGSSTDDIVPNSIGSGISSEICRKKLQNIETLVQKLRKLNSSHDEHIDYIASLCENTNPDHRYISEILLASGLILRGLGSSLAIFQFHPSGHPINPELFLVLEQMKASTLRKEECSSKKTTQSMTKEKTHRKLIFDVTNEILVGKLALAENFAEPWLKPHKMARKDLNARRLLRELCSEIDELQDKKSRCIFNNDDDELKIILCHDVMQRSESWKNFDDDISGIVLDVERLIFKDLVDEIVGKAAGSRIKPGRRRQLFAK